MSQWILGRVVALTRARGGLIQTCFPVSMDPRPSRRADAEFRSEEHALLVSMDPRPSRRADPSSSCGGLREYGVSMDPRPSRRADPVRVFGPVDGAEVSMDPRPSRRADQSPSSLHRPQEASQWILGRVVALTSFDAARSKTGEKSQWILGRVVALTRHCLQGRP